MLLLWKDEKVELSDPRETVNVGLCIEDWAVVLLALSSTKTDPDTKTRINDTIFECARTTTRSLS
jgi:hypothetical protein